MEWDVTLATTRHLHTPPLEASNIKVGKTGIAAAYGGGQETASNARRALLNTSITDSVMIQAQVKGAKLGTPSTQPKPNMNKLRPSLRVRLFKTAF